MRIREARSDSDYHKAYPVVCQLIHGLDMQTYAQRVFVARATVAQPLMLQRYIKRGIEKKGFAVIDAVTPCPALYSFFNRTGTGVEMLKSIRERSVTLQRLKSLPEGSRKEKIVCGVFADRKDDEYNDIYGTLMEKAKTEQEGEESL